MILAGVAKKPRPKLATRLTCLFHNLTTKFGQFGISSCARVFCPVIYVLAARQCRCHVARSSSGLGRRPLKAEITSSNLVRATTSFLLRLMARSSSGLGRRPLKAEITSSNLVRATKFWIPDLLFEGRVFYYLRACLLIPFAPQLYVLLISHTGTIGQIH